MADGGHLLSPEKRTSNASAAGSVDNNFEIHPAAAVKSPDCGAALNAGDSQTTRLGAAGDTTRTGDLTSPPSLQSPTPSSERGTFQQRELDWETEVQRAAGGCTEKYFEEVMNDDNSDQLNNNSHPRYHRDYYSDDFDNDPDCQTALLPSPTRNGLLRDKVRSNTVPVGDISRDAYPARDRNRQSHLDYEVDQLDTLDVESWQRQALKSGSSGPPRKVLRAQTRTGATLRPSSPSNDLLPRTSLHNEGSFASVGGANRQRWPLEIETGIRPPDHQLHSPHDDNEASTHYGEHDESTLQYVWQLVTNFTNSSSVRGKQARLTLMEILEHFDFLNDFTFICRVGFTIFRRRNDFPESPTTVITGKMAMVCLICIWLISAAAYGMRHVIIYHRIEDKDKSIFWPILVFHKIRTAGNTSPEVLYMFERLVWTYQLVMRLVEDIPQVICSAVFLTTFGSDFYTHFMISYSCMLMVITSFRMGLMYPIFGTLSLILSREPPVDSPVMAEAATTTKNFAGFMTLVFSLWTIADLMCLSMSRGLWHYTFMFLTTCSSVLSVFFTTYWFYLLKQSPDFERVVDFHRRFDSVGTPRLADDEYGDDVYRTHQLQHFEREVLHNTQRRS